VILSLAPLAAYRQYRSRRRLREAGAVQLGFTLTLVSTPPEEPRTRTNDSGRSLAPLHRGIEGFDRQTFAHQPRIADEDRCRARSSFRHAGLAPMGGRSLSPAFCFSATFSGHPERPPASCPDVRRLQSPCLTDDCRHGRGRRAGIERAEDNRHRRGPLPNFQIFSWRNL
jgi:hypothetical protein